MQEYFVTAIRSRRYFRSAPTSQAAKTSIGKPQPCNPKWLLFSEAPKAAKQPTQNLISISGCQLNNEPPLHWASKIPEPSVQHASLNTTSLDAPVNAKPRNQ